MDNHGNRRSNISVLRVFLILLRSSLFGLLIFLISAGPAAISVADESRSQRPEEQHREQEGSVESQQPEDQKPEEQRPEEPQRADDWIRRLEMLRSVPYVDVSAAEVDAGDTGVVFHDPDRTAGGYNFYCERRKGSAFLLDMDGRTVHRWTYRPTVDDHATVLENGDLAVVVKHAAVLRIDWHSREIWRRRLPAHHDIVQAQDGSFYTIIREGKSHRGMTVWFDGLIHLSKDGREIDRWSSYNHLAELKDRLDARSFLDTVLDSALDRCGAMADRRALMDDIARQYDAFDYFHINTVSLLPGTMLGTSDARFRAGNLLICLRNVNQIMVLDPKTGEILWAWGEGQLQWPHHPTMLDNGHILVFDNGVRRGYSRVIELDPVSEKIIWQYPAQPSDTLYSYFRGSAQRLENGNTLICESDEGRVFEITPGGEVVWTWLNPDIRRQHRRSLYRWTRLPESRVERLLAGDGR